MRFISGRTNCHLKGLNSYVIRDRVSHSDGMHRVFHNTGDCLPSLLDADGHYCLAPHNHRQDITLFAAKGQAFNVNFAWDRTGYPKTFREHIFRSEILGEGLSAHYHDCGDLRITGVDPIRNGLFLRSSQIHTVIAEPGSAWLVVEGQVAPEGHKSFCYSTDGRFRLSLDGLYSEMDADGLAVAWAEIGPFLPGGLSR